MSVCVLTQMCKKCAYVLMLFEADILQDMEDLVVLVNTLLHVNFTKRWFLFGHM